LGGAISVDDKIIAYTVGEMLAENTVVIHDVSIALPH
jgi:hypothetical protein